jgi:hypothetical protein
MKPVLARLGGDHLRGPMLVGAAQQLPGDRPGIVRIVEPRIGHAPPRFAQLAANFRIAAKRKAIFFG